ncbi:hypothetical protein V8G54_009502 [Vigna mungo]|uniref:Uncharacterized protein n=1 Tax=Vigna mungo TaxID=3915 RepID=A0AAQ3NVA7_VIGMU
MGFRFVPRRIVVGRRKFQPLQGSVVPAGQMFPEGLLLFRVVKSLQPLQGSVVPAGQMFPEGLSLFRTVKSLEVLLLFATIDGNPIPAVCCYLQLQALHLFLNFMVLVRPHPLLSKLKFHGASSPSSIAVQIGSSPGFEDGDFESAKLRRPAGSYYHPPEDCLYFVDSENHVIRKADMGARTVETLYPTSTSDKGGIHIWNWIMTKLGLESSGQTDVEETSEVFDSKSLYFPWHLLKSVDDTLYVIDRSFNDPMWSLETVPAYKREILEMTKLLGLQSLIDGACSGWNILPLTANGGNDGTTQAQGSPSPLKCQRQVGVTKGEENQWWCTRRRRHQNATRITMAGLCGANELG